jgi:hypothetical protein
MPRPLIVLLALASAAHASAAPAAPASPVYAGVSGATLLDSGTMRVEAAGPFGRVESFEYLTRPDGGHVLLNSITALGGGYRLQGRFDLDKSWRSQSAQGIGLYQGTPVSVALSANGPKVDIRVRPHGAGQGGPRIDATAACDPDCFIDMAPSILPMFVMTRHYDFARGGPQTFRWAGQDLQQPRTLGGGIAALSLKAETQAARAGGGRLAVRHFTFVETMPLPGPKPGSFSLNFDLWTDTDHRPLGYRVFLPNGDPAGLIGWRTGYEDIRAALIARSPT